MHSQRDRETSAEPSTFQLFKVTHTRQGIWSRHLAEKIYVSNCSIVIMLPHYIFIISVRALHKLHLPLSLSLSIRHHGDCQRQNPMRMLRKNQQVSRLTPLKKTKLSRKRTCKQQEPNLPSHVAMVTCRLTVTNESLGQT